jgi:sugar lactone lactonase YvrE
MRRLFIVLLLLTAPTAVTLVVYLLIRPTNVPTNPNAVGHVTRFAGSAMPGHNDGELSSARFADPFGITLDRHGNVYVADGGQANRIRRITTTGKVETIAGSSEGFADDEARSARFDTPSGIAIDSKGNIVIADTSNNRIRRIDSTGRVTTLAGNGAAGYLDGNGAQAQFDGPLAVAVDNNDDVYVADTYNDCIRRVSPAGEVTTVAGAPGPGFKDGDAGSAQFNTPCGIAIDPSGALFISDTGNNAIRRISASGEVSTVAGGSRGRLDGRGRDASFDNPVGIALTHDGFLFVTDEESGRIRRVSPDGQVSTYAGRRPGFADGFGEAARLNGPTGIAVDREGNLYVCDTSNYLIRLIAPAPAAAGEDIAETSKIIQPEPDAPAPVPAPDLTSVVRAESAEFPWPLAPRNASHEITGVVGEARGAPGGVALDHLHNGLDIRAREGEEVFSVFDEKVSSPVPAWDFGNSSEGIRVGLFSYIHIRLGRRGDLLEPDSRFVALRDEAGLLVGVRVRRGARFRVGDFVGTVNRLNHVHLNLGPWNAQANPIKLGFSGLTDTTPPVVEPNGIQVVDETGNPLNEKRDGRTIIHGDIRIVVTAYDRVDGNSKVRKLGLYRAGYQLLREDGTPAAGFEAPLINIDFDRLPPGDESVLLVYAEGSGVSAYGTPTRFRYIVTNVVRDGTAREGILTVSGSPPGRYVLKAIAEDFAGNRATGPTTELPVIVR